MNDDTCKDTREQLPLYVYGELSETEPIERHLAECVTCRREWEATKHALAVIDRAGLDTAPDAVVEAVIDGVLPRIRPIAKWDRRRTRIVQITSVAACLLIGMFGMWFFLHQRDPDRLAANALMKPTEQELKRQTKAVTAEADAVLRLLDELEAENDVIAGLLGNEAPSEPAAKSAAKPKERESA